MGVPKSKISPSRKRMKHLQHVPDKIGWLQCKKCGEPKRPHRICTKHIDICAMRDDEYEQQQKKLEK
jgi:large subunit ribosomal protein L32